MRYFLACCFHKGFRSSCSQNITPVLLGKAPGDAIASESLKLLYQAALEFFCHLRVRNATISCLPFTNSEWFLHWEFGVEARATLSGSREFQASLAGPIEVQWDDAFVPA
jgi:hypothetical protein